MGVASAQLCHAHNVTKLGHRATLSAIKARASGRIKASGAAACPGAGRRLKTALYAADFLHLRATDLLR